MSDSTKKPATVLTLADARKQTPPVSGLGAWAEAMKAAALDAVRPEDMAAIVAKQIEKAKKGDAGAAKFVLGLVASAAKAVPPQAPMLTVQAHEPDPPRPVAIDSPGAEQQRLLVAMTLLNHQPMTVAGLGNLVRLPAEQLDAILNHEWFARQSGQVRLTTAGRRAAG